MYPKYFKKTGNADTCFSVINSFDNQNKKFRRVSVSLSKDSARFYNNLSLEFGFEIFSPHGSDMNSSNNCSLVCKVKELATRSTYLITGDTETDRWGSIVRYFGDAISSDVIAAPHHGSKNGISADAIKLIEPHTVIVSAGVNNQYGHPDAEAKRLFKTYATSWCSTNGGDGQSLKTVTSATAINTYKFST